MHIVWDRRTLEWFRQASEFTGYDRALARLLLDRIPCRDSLCDLGCGAGLVDMELAAHIRRVTCVDLAPVAVDGVRETARQRGLTNITALCADGRQLRGRWSTVLAVFHGDPAAYGSYFRLAVDRLLLVTHSDPRRGFGPAESQAPRREEGTSLTRDFLEKEGVRYRLTETALEHGQPFADLAAAREFVGHYADDLAPAALEVFLRENLVETGDPRFPLYLPKRKPIGLFVICREENPGLWQEEGPADRA